MYYGRYYTFCPCKVSILFLMLQIKTEKRVVLRPKPCDFFYNLPFFDEMMRCFVCFSWYKSNFSRQRVFACGFTCVFFLVCFSLTFLLVFLLVFLRFFAWGFLLAVSCLRVLEDNRDNGDNGLILNSMLSEDNNKYNFYQPKGWLPLENFWRGLFDGQGWLFWLARLTILACKIDYFGV